MAKGGQPSVIITAEEHDATRRAKKAAQRRHKGGTGRARPDGSDIMSEIEKERHALFLEQVETEIRTSNHGSVDSTSTEAIDFTIEGFIHAFRCADPKTYKSQGMTRTRYAGQQARQAALDVYGQRRSGAISYALKICREAVRSVSETQNELVPA